MAVTRTLPPVARRCSLPIISGAAVTRLAVKAAAALAGKSATMRAKSARPLALRPALAAPKRKPLGIKNLDLPDVAVMGFNPFNLTGELLAKSVIGVGLKCQGTSSVPPPKSKKEYCFIDLTN